MLEVVDLQIDQHIGEVRRPSRHADIVDIAVVLGDHLCNLGERAGLVHRLHRDARREAARRARFLVPAHVQPAFRLVLELTQCMRLDRVDGDPLARREDADNAVARHRAAVRRKTDRQVAVDAADRDRRANRGDARHLELDRGELLQAEPAAFRLGLHRHGGGALFLVVGIHGARDVRGFQFAAPDRRHHVFDGRARQPRQRAGELLVRVGDLGALEQAFDDAAAEPGILLAHRRARGAPDRGARLAGDHDRFPRRRRRRLRLRGEDIDLVAIDDFRAERRDLAVDLAAHRGVADVGVHRIGEVDRRRLARQCDQLALGREAEHLIVEQL